MRHRRDAGHVLPQARLLGRQIVTDAAIALRRPHKRMIHIGLNHAATPDPRVWQTRGSLACSGRTVHASD
ncbi:hypothetical protein CKY51_11500 [Xanthomonas maliensis]|nr:hypothetical protein CKY51_11500 [Xanthomonas maliensis]